MSAPIEEKIWAGNTPDVAASTHTGAPGATAEGIGAHASDEEIKEKELEGPIEEVEVGDIHAANATRQPLTRSSSARTAASDPSTIADIPELKHVPASRSWTTRINPFKSKYLPPIPQERQVSREYKASFFSLLTFQWMAPIMAVGYQRPLVEEDIWTVNPDRSVNVLSAKLMENFKRRRANGDKNALKWALYDTNKFEFILGGVAQFVAQTLQVLSPYTLRYLIDFATEAYDADLLGTAGPNIGNGIGLVIGISIMQLFMSSANNHFLYRGMTVGGQSRAALIVLIFDKAMKISGRARAGGKAMGELPTDVKPGSEEEKSWFKKHLPKSKKKEEKSKAGVQGAGVGWSNGRIVTLMSVDTYRVDQASSWFHMLWTAPWGIALSLVLLCVNLGYSALAGFALLVIVMPLLGRAVGNLFARRKKINVITDQRVSLTQEIVQGVRFVKYFGWETSFLERLAEIRKYEISKIQVVLSIRNFIMSFGMAMPVFAAMLSFITYSLTHSSLVPATVFSSLALFNSLRMPLNFLPLVIGQVVDASASIQRIEEFLVAEEAEDTAEWDNNANDAILVQDAGFTWERTKTADADNKTPTKAEKADKAAAAKAQEKSGKEKQAVQKESVQAGKKSGRDDQISRSSTDEQTSGSDSGMDSSSNLGQEPKGEEDEKPFDIKNINIAIGRKELIAVIGTVGSGKSSLLGALAGDMRKTSGSVTLGASRAFCPQYAWIQNATVKENITFGKEYNRKWYNQVVDACALRPDLEMLPNGDMTEIGERGITVSGGQKQRLNIARAIYFDADIILMDDPLSAVDAHVGRHIMDNAICGLLKDKCRVLATHQLHVLHRCDRIIFMKEGRIRTVDTFDNLMSNDADFQEMMRTTAKEEARDEEESPEDVKKKSPSKKAKKGLGLMQAEERAVKSVGVMVYGAYVKASGSLLVAPLVLFLLIIAQGSNIVTSLWLSWWTATKFGLSEGTYIGVYAGFGVFQVCMMFAYSSLLTIAGTTASRVMLQRAVTRVLRAPMSFFDTTPLGRITNRFSKDVDTMDNNLTDSFRMFLITAAAIISVFILIIAYFYYFAIALAPMLVLWVFFANYYRASAREIKRHEAVLRSAVFSRFSEAVSGVSTIRAYGLQKQFSDSVREATDTMDSAYFLTFSNQRWLSLRLDLIGNVLIFTTGILVVTSRFDISPSIGGLVLSYILTIVQMIQFVVRQLAEVENNMNSAERIHYYGTQLEEEAPLHAAQVRPSWPESGEIVFDNVQMRYREGLPLVLKGLNLHVKAGERVGVVGRTGAGKSTIMSTLFRLSELSGGSITVDGVDISKVGLADLRSRLSIIPQDPTLFRGTIRTNLDPFDQHTDLELWSALRQADLVGDNQGMDDRSNSARIHLDALVEEEGLNFSLGQRQLMALARALVRNSRIIVCDEATSSVDFETDAKIQQTILTGFKGRTLMCIAHRLKTIITYDRIVVMDGGVIAEVDTPYNLWRAQGIFHSMCQRSGITERDLVRTEGGKLEIVGDVPDVDVDQVLEEVLEEIAAEETAAERAEEVESSYSGSEAHHGTGL